MTKEEISDLDLEKGIEYWENLEKEWNDAYDRLINVLGPHNFLIEKEQDEN
jgi:hypothetical protein